MTVSRPEECKDIRATHCCCVTLAESALDSQSQWICFLLVASHSQPGLVGGMKPNLKGVLAHRTIAVVARDVQSSLSSRAPTEVNYL